MESYYDSFTGRQSLRRQRVLQRIYGQTNGKNWARLATPADMAIAQAAAERAGVPVSALCMVGDRLYTDVALGRAAGFPSVLVLSGETQAAEVDGSPHQPDFVFANLGELGRALAAADAATDGVSDETESTP
jgi:ribonucleotide monophosphatase NagD (HAD superfamily)